MNETFLTAIPVIRKYLECLNYFGEKIKEIEIDEKNRKLQPILKNVPNFAKYIDEKGVFKPEYNDVKDIFYKTAETLLD
jgi:hypothetical protein